MVSDWTRAWPVSGRDAAREGREILISVTSLEAKYFLSIKPQDYFMDYNLFNKHVFQDVYKINIINTSLES